MQVVRQFRNPQEEIAHLQQENTRQARKIEYLTSEVVQLRQKLRDYQWRDKWAMNKGFSSADKAVGAELMKTYQKTEADADGWVKLYEPAVAASQGVSTQTVSKAIQRLEGVAVEVRRQKEGGYKQGVKTHVEFKLLETFKQEPATIEPAEKRNHGGKRLECPHCHQSSEYEVVPKVTCLHCGGVFYGKKRLVKTKLEPVVDDKPVNSYWDDKEVPVEERQETPELETIVQEVVDTLEGTVHENITSAPIIPLRRPIMCHCGVRSRWVNDRGVLHCTACEISYGRYRP